MISFGFSSDAGERQENIVHLTNLATTLSDKLLPALRQYVCRSEDRDHRCCCGRCMESLQQSMGGEDSGTSIQQKSRASVAIETGNLLCCRNVACPIVAIAAGLLVVCHSSSG